ncbi:LapA family protein [Mycobacterium sp. pR1184]|uniref:LapA family protein n=1 Tax=Mycobacterium sp. pR1184 TaxID=3238981 RepID=UPI00351AFCBE
MEHNSRSWTDDGRTGPPQRSVRTPGMLVVGAAVIALVVCVVGFALGQIGIGLSAAIVGLMALGVGLDWLAMDGRRIRQAEREWFASHPAR